MEKGNAKVYRWVQGREGVENRGFTAYLLYGWPLTVNFYADFSLENLIICMSDQRVMKIRQLKVNCLAIFNFLNNNQSIMLFFELALILVKLTEDRNCETCEVYKSVQEKNIKCTKKNHLIQT